METVPPGDAPPAVDPTTPAVPTKESLLQRAAEIEKDIANLVVFFRTNQDEFKLLEQEVVSAGGTVAGVIANVVALDPALSVSPVGPLLKGALLFTSWIGKLKL